MNEVCDEIMRIHFVIDCCYLNYGVVHFTFQNAQDQKMSVISRTLVFGPWSYLFRKVLRKKKLFIVVFQTCQNLSRARG
jgi:hypothetical protein